MHQKISTVALYDTLGPEAYRFIIWQTQLVTIGMAKDLVAALVKLKKNDLEQAEQKMTTLKNVVVFDEGQDDGALVESLAEVGLKYFAYSKILKEGQDMKNNKEGTIIEPQPNDVYMLSYTSGTTGDPKGVKLTHKMILNEAGSINVGALGADIPLSENDCYISYLPAAHSFEQVLFGVSLVYGMKCGYFGGNVLTLTEDIQILKPTFFPSVPRLWNRIYGKLKAKIEAATGVAGWLANKAVESKLNYLKTGQGYTHKFYDAVVFSKMKAGFGGNVRIMCTGSAPISGEVLDFLKVSFCCPLTEGYGMTESCGGACGSYPEDNLTGHVGGPFRCNKIKLRDIPEMGYFSTDKPHPRGEIMFYGSNVSPGYFCNVEKNKEAFFGKWLLSGDVGTIRENGSVKVIDRAKNIFKLSQGEYVAPEKLENVYVQSEFISQNWIHGESTKDWIIGFFIMDTDVVKAFATKNQIPMNDEIYESDALRQAVYATLMKLAKDNNFSGLEKPKQFILLKDPFTVESDILTPTMKLKRNVAKTMFKEQIEQMYSMEPFALKK